MKKIKLILVMLTICTVMPAVSFADIDFGAYGGYVFYSEIQTTGTDLDPRGAEYGAFFHLGFDIVPAILDIAFGAYYQRSDQTFEISGTDYTFERNTIGVDAYAELTILVVVDPFVRVAANVWDGSKVEGGGTNHDYFATYSVGVGAYFQFIPLVSFFLDYTQTFGELDDNKYTNSAVHAGIRVKI